MVAKKYLKLDDTYKAMAEESAVETSNGSGDEGKIIALNSDGKLDDTMLPDGVGAEVIVLPASVALSANDVVNIFDDSGTIKVRKADATDGTKPTHGFVKESVTLGANATIYLDGELPGTGLTVGSTYFLATTPGGVTATPPSTSGNLWQAIGVAISTTVIGFNPEKGIIRA